LLRRHGARGAVEIGVNIALPSLIYAFGKHRLGETGALMASSAPPVLWAVWEFARRRVVDAISVMAIAGIALSLAAVAMGGSPKLLLLRERMITAAIGLIFIGSAAIGRPVIFELARAGMRRNASSELAVFEANREHPALRRTMITMTLVWGFGLVLEAGVAATLVFSLTSQQYLIVGPLFGYSVMGLLAGWSFLYVRSRRRRRLAATGALKAAGVSSEAGD
jgi:hypothetical protein